MELAVGVEPTIFCLRGRRFSQLSYASNELVRVVRFELTISPPRTARISHAFPHSDN